MNDSKFDTVPKLTRESYLVGPVGPISHLHQPTIYIAHDDYVC